MSTKVTLLSMIFIVSISASSFAGIDCGPYKINYIQIENNTVFFYPAGNGQNWQSLGSLSGNGTKERYAALLAAQMSGNKVTTRFTNNDHNCKAYNLQDIASMVRIHAAGK
jgi:hypothetical protein